MIDLGFTAGVLVGITIGTAVGVVIAALSLPVIELYTQKYKKSQINPPKQPRNADKCIKTH